jgi:hypothetical protein
VLGRAAVLAWLSAARAGSPASEERALP